MPVPYAGGSGSIGALLRKIEEEKKTSPAAIKPGAEAAAPIRQAMPQPFETPESVGTSRTVSVKPEGVTQPGTPGVAPVVTPAAAVPTPAPAPAVTPAAPVPTPSAAGPMGPSQPSAPAPAAPSQPRGVSVAMSLGQQLKPSTGMVMGAKTASAQPSQPTQSPSPRPNMPSAAAASPASTGLMQRLTPLFRTMMGQKVITAPFFAIGDWLKKATQNPMQRASKQA